MSANTMAASEAVRAFIALDLDEPTRAWAAEMQTWLKSLCGKADWRMRWVRPENLHFTLKFLGQVEVERIPALQDQLRSFGDQPALSPSLEGLGSFPPTGRPKVLFLRVAEGFEAMAQLAEAVEERTQSLGFERERKAFHPHLTLGRVNRAKSSLAALLEQARSRSGSFPELRREAHLGQLTLYRSILGSGGARYEPLERVRLGSPEDGPATPPSHSMTPAQPRVRSGRE